MNNGLLGYPRAERFSGFKDYPQGGWQEMIAAVESTTVRNHTTLSTWETISETTMTFYARKGEVYLLRCTIQMDSPSTNFDTCYISPSIDGATQEFTTPVYCQPASNLLASRASNVSGTSWWKPGGSVFVLSGLPEGTHTVALMTFDNNSNQDRRFNYTYLSLRRVGLPRPKTRRGPYGWPLDARLTAPVRTGNPSNPGMSRGRRIIGHAVDSSSRSFVTDSVDERITGTEITFTPRSQMNEYELIAYIMCKPNTSASWDREFYNPQIDEGQGYFRSGVNPWFNAVPDELEILAPSNNPNALDHRPWGMSMQVYNLRPMPQTLALFTNDNGTGQDRNIDFTSVVLVETLPYMEPA